MHARTKGKLFGIRALFVQLVFAWLCLPALSLPPPLPSHVFYDLHVGPNQQLVAIHSDGMYRSTDGGRNWQRTSGPVSGVLGGRFLDGGVHGLFMVLSDSMYRSTDTGLTWSRTGTASRHVTIDPEGVLYGCGKAVEVSHDFGKTWAPTKTRPIPSQAGHCSGIVRGGGRVYVLWYSDVGRGLSASQDRGVSWQTLEQLNRHLGDRQDPHEIFIDSQGGVYVNVFDHTPAAGSEAERVQHRVHQGTRNGSRWRELRFGEPDGIDPIELRAVHGTTLYASCGPVHEGGFCVATADGAASRKLVFEGKPFLHVIGARLKIGPGGEIYTVDMYGLHRIDLDRGDVHPLEGRGIPDPHTGRVK